MGFKRRAPSSPLEKIRIDLPNHWATGGESLWAAKLGDDLYEVRNIPFYIYDLNFLDHVVATSPSDELKPIIRRVVKRSGRSTLRAILSKAGMVQRDAIVEELTSRGCGCEWVGDAYVAIDIPPETGAKTIEAQLIAWQSEGWLDYETCEARAPGSFDAGDADPDID